MSCLVGDFLFEFKLIFNFSSNFSEVKHMFDEQGYVEAIASENKAGSDLLSACTEDAIEAGAEDVEIMNEESRLIRVSTRIFN